MTKFYIRLYQGVLLALAGLAVASIVAASIYNPPQAASVTGFLSAASNLSDIVASSTAAANLGLDPEQCTEPAFVIENPTATEDDVYWIAKATSTITRFRSVHKSTGDTVTFNLIWSSSRSQSSSTSQHLFTSNVTSTATTTIDAYPTLVAFASTTVNANSVVRLITSAASSSQWTTSLCYRINAQ